MKTSHHGEHRSFPAHHAIPIEHMRDVRTWDGVLVHRHNSNMSRLYKRTHARRVRQFYNREIRDYDREDERA